MPIQFGDFALDESRRQLFGGGEAVHLSPKAFQLLSILIQERPRAISKNDLQERLWPDTFVTEGNLSSVVAELRSALGDDAHEPRFIRTLYGFGYSFAAPIGDVAPPADSQQVAEVASEPSKHFVSGIRWTSAGVAALLGAAGIVLILSLRSITGSGPVLPSTSIRSIAVLPFDTTGTDASQQHLGLGLSDLLITRLSNVRELTVRPTSAIRDYKGPHLNSRQIGRDLKVDALLEGSVRASPERVRVTVQLLDVRQQKPIWADSFDEKRTEMFSIEDNISSRVAKALMVQVTPGEQTLLAKRYTTNPEAYELYIQGRYRLHEAGGAGTGRSVRLTSQEAAHDFFQKAVDKDPQYALAWAGLAQTYINMGWFSDRGARLPPATAYPKAETAALKALQLDDKLSEAHVAIGAVKAAWYLDYAGAEREFVRAVELSPKNIGAHVWLAHLVQSLGRFDEAIALRKRSLEIDPLDANLQWGLANAYLTAHRYDAALRQLNVVLGMDPNYYEARVAQLRVAVAQGRYDEAIAMGRRLVATDPANTHGLSFLGWAYGMAGRKAEAREILQSLQQQDDKHHLSPLAFAVVYMGMDDRDAVLRVLEKALVDRTYAVRLKTEPVFDPLHSDPRFIALLHKGGFKD
jgi:TolB-like protein/DNA-binding winged helix-turn-helix (wHTH) protein/tetratricopeptide (TPR) repeat protein